jgi:hypothetical protein
MNFAKVQTIRDAQREQKQALYHQRIAEELEKDRMMEEARLKSLHEFEAMELDLHERNHQCGAAIREQISARQARRLEEEELKRRERMHIVKQMELAEKEEARVAALRRDEQHKNLEEVLSANAVVIEEKRKRKDEEQRHDQAIMEYLRQQDLIAKAAEESKRQALKTREEALNKLRAKQEKQADRLAELDAIRAKRAAEANERKAREAIRLAQEKQNATAVMLMESRALQQAEKEHQLIEEARIEKAEFDEMIRVQVELERLDREVKKAEIEKSKFLAEQLQKQIENAERAKRDLRAKKFTEGKELAQLRALQQQALENLKAEKLKEMEKLRIPPKHRLNLTKYASI